MCVDDKVELRLQCHYPYMRQILKITFNQITPSFTKKGTRDDWRLWRSKHDSMVIGYPGYNVFVML